MVVREVEVEEEGQRAENVREVFQRVLREIQDLCGVTSLRNSSPIGPYGSLMPREGPMALGPQGARSSFQLKGFGGEG